MSDQSQPEHVNTWENNQSRPEQVNPMENNQSQPEQVNPMEINLSQPEQVNPMEINQPQPEQVNPLEINQSQPEQVNPWENDHFYEKPLETPVAIAETVQDAGSPGGKTEPWKQPSAPVSTFTPTPIPTPVPATQVVVNTASPEMLFGSEETKHFRARWNEVQAKFVDEPGSSVREADALVTEVMTQYSQMLANERRALEGQWKEGDISTENLRQVLQRYRSFFNRLLI